MCGGRRLLLELVLPPVLVLAALLLLLLLLVSMLVVVEHQLRLRAKRMNSRPYHSARGAPVLRWRQPASHTMQLWEARGGEGKGGGASAKDGWSGVGMGWVSRVEV